MPPLKIAYFGLPLGAYLLARDGHELNPCVLSPIEAPGRRRVSRQVDGALLDALKLAPGALEQAVSAALSAARPELLVSWFWTRLLPATWLERCPRGAIGVHPSLLPRHRGPNPYFWAIDAGDEQTGVTLHTLTPEYDRGAILDTRRVAVGDRNAWQLARALDRPSLELLRQGALAVVRGRELSGQLQDETLTTWAPEPTGSELRADFHWSSQRILRRIRALAPVPGLAIEVRGIAFFVTAASRSERQLEALEVGEAGVLADPATLIIRTADGAIAVDRAVWVDGERETTLDRAGLAALIAAAAVP